ncbi:hypothetical protein [Ferrimonas balearica]|uniref:hypothetical protein n=1 Tax=Ferrimonas balearica TaxID=44012 RepID=UPI001C99EEB7|nr:hypothetical protein [Ferrimonas balearica]MBY5992661.1 hypothetical protein [Ferrimonas balearica]
MATFREQGRYCEHCDIACSATIAFRSWDDGYWQSLIRCDNCRATQLQGTLPPSDKRGFSARDVAQHQQKHG